MKAGNGRTECELSSAQLLFCSDRSTYLSYDKWSSPHVTISIFRSHWFRAREIREYGATYHVTNLICHQPPSGQSRIPLRIPHVFFVSSQADWIPASGDLYDPTVTHPAYGSWICRRKAGKSLRVVATRAIVYAASRTTRRHRLAFKLGPSVSVDNKPLRSKLHCSWAPETSETHNRARPCTSLSYSLKRFRGSRYAITVPASFIAGRPVPGVR